MQSTQLELFPYLETEESSRPPNFIPVYEPTLGRREEEYVLEAVRSGWISHAGAFVGRFEQEFADFCNVRHAISTCNGTVALHLALAALDIGPGDEVIVPALTFVASANAVTYTGATPVFADVDPVSWVIDPVDIERKLTPRTKAIMPVHLYGHPAPMHEINELARAHNLLAIEDAAEAHGAELSGQRAGTMSRIASFSFMANKIITTGEGGMVTTDDDGLNERCRHLRDHAMRPEKRYWHNEVGFNYRMTNLQAAVGVAQMQSIDRFIARKREIAALYDDYLADIRGLSLPVELPDCTNVYWMYSIVVGDEFPLTRDALIPILRERNIDSRPFFYPMDTLPPYLADAPCPISLDLSQRGLNLPSAPTLTNQQVAYICQTLRDLAQR